jgi:hypothetical protein
VGEANQRFGRKVGKRNGPASSKGMLRGNRNTNPIVKQLFVAQIAQRTRLWGRNYQTELKAAVAYAVENGLVSPIKRFKTPRSVRRLRNGSVCPSRLLAFSLHIVQRNQAKPMWRNGRRNGLKIRSRENGVWVRIPPSAPLKIVFS